LTGKKVAREEGVISAADDLLFPKFYCAEKIKDWLRETVESWVADRPKCIIEAGG
jgi:hypothetical protein